MRARALDPVRFEILHSALLSVTDEMGAVLKRSSYSPIIREMDDYSCALFDAGGRLVAQGDFIPSQLGAISLVVRATLARHRSTLAPGDVFIANSPYVGGAHTPDVNILHPVFRDGALFAWTGTVAHHADFGGPNPGTEGADLNELYAEGLILPPVRLYRRGEPDAELFDLIGANVRDTVATLADLRAQTAACWSGERRLAEVVEDHGAAAVETAFERALDHAERRTRAALAALRDGEGEAEGFLDDDGAAGPPTRIHARLTKRGDRLTVDFSGSAAQVPGALNNPWASTRACVVFLVKVLADPALTSNDGALRPITIVCPEGSVLRPRPPAAVSVRHLTCQRTADTLLRAAGAVWPEKAVASGMVGFFGINAGGTSPRSGRPTAAQDVVGGGTGGHRLGDGLDGVDTYMSNVGLLPVEVAESEYPMRILRSELIAGSGGDGRGRGGLGIRRDYLLLEEWQTVTLYCEQSDPRFVPRGAAGGGDGTPTRFRVFAPDGTEMRLRSQKVTLRLPRGSLVRVESGGGAGWGDPAERPAPLRTADEADGRV
ncbi:MAG: hypothetical protein A2X23_10070 [Chloroflexi bacterium GWC2_73_18]|nr:MAG: hypothetical protein A2X23_10070 [Chloroflexi bacterium GWC2_73_18]